MVVLLKGLLLCCAVVFTLADPIPPETLTYWTRLNYGVAAVKTKQVCVATGYWSLGVTIQLPNVTAVVVNRTTPHDPQACLTFCDRLRNLLAAVNALTYTMQSSISKTVHRIFSLLPDVGNSVWPPRARRTRGHLDFVGRAYKFAFGVATEGDVAGMKRLIERGDTLAATAVADVMRIRDGMSTFTKLSNERLDKMHEILQRDQASLSSLYQSVRQNEHIDTLEFNGIAYATQELAKFISIHDELQLLELGVEDLIHGQITPRLIAADVLDNALRDIQNELAKRHEHLCFDKPNEVYAVQNFEFARKNDKLFVRINLPFSDRLPMDVFRIDTLPIPVPSQQALTTRIKDIPQFILKGSQLLGELNQEPTSLVVDMSTIKWHHINQAGCLTGLITDSPVHILAHCEFTVRKQLITPTFIRLTDDILVLSNLTRLYQSCDPGTFTRPTPHACMPCMVRVGCGCLLTAAELEVPSITDCANTTSRVDVGHAVNMAVLQSFYDMTNETLMGQSILPPDQLRTPEPLNLTFFGDTERLLAADEQASYSLRKLADSLKNDTVIVHTPAEAVLRQLLNQAADDSTFPGWFNWYTYVTLLPLPCIIILSVWLYLTSRKLSTLSTITGVSACARLTRAFVLPSTMQPTSTPDPFAWLLEIQAIRKFDAFVSVYGIFATIAFIVLIVAVKRLYRRRSWVYIEIRADIDKILQIRLYAFPSPTRNYSLRAPNPTTLVLRSYHLFGILSFTTRAWRITDSSTGQVTLLPTYVFVPFWKINAIATILAAPRCVAFPVLIYSHEYDYRAAKNKINPPPYPAPLCVLPTAPVSSAPAASAPLHNTPPSDRYNPMEDIDSIDETYV